MKKIILRYGIFGGLVVGSVLAFSSLYYFKGKHFAPSMLLGYSSMILAFSLIYVAVKAQRDKYYGGSISFGKALKTGLLITLVTSTIYVAVWLVCYYAFLPDFMQQYSDYMLKKAQADGMSAAEQAKQAAQIQQYVSLYKNPLFVILLTYAEIVPVGIVVSLIVAFILKRKVNRQFAGAAA